MPLIKLALPPGLYHNGTKYQAYGRWYDGNGVRWVEGTIQPIGGWIALNDSDDVQVQVSGAARCLLPWQANDGKAYLAIGTHTKLYVFNEGTLLDATFTGVAATATLTLGGSGLNNQTVTIDGKVYTLKASLTDTDGFVKLGSTATETRDNLVAAITLGAGAGTLYAASTTIHPTVTASAVDADKLLATAKTKGAAGNSIAISTDITSASWSGSGFLVGGIAPFVTGRAHTTFTGGGYNIGGYNKGGYGVGDASQTTRNEASVWQLDSFGEDLVGCVVPSGRLYYWDRSAGGEATPMANSPTSCVGIVVTPERFVVALGAGAEPRTVAWAHQETLDTWTSDATNTAGDFILEGKGKLMCGRRARNETLLWTDADLWAMRYIGGTLVYSFVRLGDQCGIIARNAVALVGGAQAFWMGRRGFFTYDGFAKPLPCEVSDYVFGDLNQEQREKIVATSRQQYGEVTWYYPSLASNENDRYVTYNYREGHWYYGQLARTADADHTPFENPLAVDPDGYLWKHETGNIRSGMTPYLESGPVELGDGQVVQQILQVYPDERTLGDVEATLYASLYPTATERTQTVNLANPTSVRITGRQVRVKLTETTATSWRVGNMRIRTVPAGER